MSAVSGTRRSIKELVDGTIRVQIDIDPFFRKQFFELFSEIDMAVALAPLRVRVGTTEIEEPTPVAFQGPQPAEPKEKPGPLCRLAVQWCQEAAFQSWAYRQSNHHSDATEEGAKKFICHNCNVESRKELDTNSDAEEKFQRLIRLPYMKYLEGK